MNLIKTVTFFKHRFNRHLPTTSPFRCIVWVKTKSKHRDLLPTDYKTYLQYFYSRYKS